MTTSGTRSTKVTRVSSRSRDRINRARLSYEKLWEDVKPFVRKRKITQYSTAGQWKVLSYET